jgi:hypothetical protein
MIPTRHGKDGQYEVTVPTIGDRVGVFPQVWKLVT